MKKLLAFALASTMVFAVGCQAPAAPAATPEAPAADATAAPTEEAPKADAPATDEPIKLAYVLNFSSHEFYQNICKGAEETAKQLGATIEFADPNGDVNKQISLGETLLTKDIDALIVTPVDAQGVMPLIDQAMDAGVPVITESVKAVNQTCYVGIDDLQGGYLDGKAAGEWVKANNFPTPKVLLVGLPALEACVNRTEGFKKGLLEVIPEAQIVAEVDGQGAKDKAMAKATDALTANPDVNMIMGINDDSTLGGVQAYMAAGGDPKNLVAFGFGVEGVAAKRELVDPASPYQGGLAMFPENIGKLLVETAIAAVKGETVPADVMVPFDVMTKENVTKYYTQDGDNWNINWDAVNQIAK